MTVELTQLVRGNEEIEYRVAIESGLSDDDHIATGATPGAAFQEALLDLLIKHVEEPL